MRCSRCSPTARSTSTSRRRGLRRLARHRRSPARLGAHQQLDEALLRQRAVLALSFLCGPSRVPRSHSPTLAGLGLLRPGPGSEPQLSAPQASTSGEAAPGSAATLLQEPVGAEAEPVSHGRRRGPTAAKLGVVDIACQPTSCTVSLDDKPMGEPPLLNRQVPLGTHRFVLVNSETASPRPASSRSSPRSEPRSSSPSDPWPEWPEAPWPLAVGSSHHAVEDFNCRADGSPPGAGQARATGRRARTARRWCGRS
jgi:hypothetical protein